ncbi:MAG: ImmA/IrrE family metallo-endopeptidase [Fibrobacter intestinalis]|uniref:ImmA/IrrE family metallo-endopeptidase n=1 Tax=Fibrobacter intestinalis TaxID=28122 RepID=UPI003EFD6657
MRTYKIARPRSIKEIQEVTQVFRALMGCGDLDSCKILDFIEFTLPKLQKNFVLKIAPTETMPFKEGETWPTNSTMCIREDVYNKAIEGCPRSFFTLAHELGHLFLHSGEDVSFCRSECEINIPPYQNAEWQANVFAAELLAPSSSISKYNLTVDEIQKHFKVSRECAQKCFVRVHRRKMK